MSVDEDRDAFIKASLSITLCYTIQAAKELADERTADLKRYGIDEQHWVVVEYHPDDGDVIGPTRRRKLYVVNVDGLADLEARANVSIIYETGFDS